METALTSTVFPLAGTEAAMTEAEFEVLVTEHQRAVYRVLYVMIRDHDEAATITQECFLRAYQARDSYRGEASARTWLVRIATNLAIDHIRNRRWQFWRRLLRPRDGLPPRPAPTPSPERQLLAREEIENVWAAVNSMPARQRSVFVLRYAEDMSLEDIASTLDMEVGTVKSHLARAIASLRKRLGEKS